MAEKVDKDVREAAAEWGWLTDMGSTPEFDASHILVQAFAAMKEAGRQQGLCEAAEVAGKRKAVYLEKADLADPFGQDDGNRHDRMIHTAEAHDYLIAAITALMEGEGK